MNGITVLRKRRPHTTVQVGAISSFVLSRNRYASGYLVLPLAVWHSREYSPRLLGLLTDSSLEQLRRSVAEGIAAGTMGWQLVLDNVQQYCRQRDHRRRHQDVLKVGTAATAILLEDCAPRAFDLQDHLDRGMKQERLTFTTESLYADIDWGYIHELTALHWVRILITFIPELAHLRQIVADVLNSDRMTKRRLRKGRKTVMQPLGTNAEQETETQGMMRALLDFENQMGFDEKAMEGPEIWHTRWTKLNGITSNSYAPASSADPAALSKSATAAGAKRPSNLKKVNFFRPRIA
ncbi:hypothetical protein B0H10DRAFT_2208149 [Mycena sp. CBHHK59/15]|nr:hypothetical protein B0H10DRAFT_2208149 [Mycena sp. CBHHK59/15]